MISEKLKILQIIHLGICVGVSIAYFIIGDFSSLENPETFTINEESMIFFLIPIASVFLSNFLYKSQIKNANPNLSLEEKFPIYQTASIIRFAVLEAAAFLILVLKPNFLIPGILLVAYIVFLRPTEVKFKNDFGKI